MIIRIQIALLAGLVLSLSACKTNLEPRAVSSGSADLSRYVAIGNSLTAGYADGALYRDGQINSYPNMLAGQFALAGGGSFTIPFMNPGAGNDASGNPRRVLGYVLPCGSASPTLSPVFDSRGATPINNVSAAGPYNLIGVPGARAIDAQFSLYSSLNPFLQRFCKTPGTSTMLSEALRVNPTFFTLFLGSNDVLLYATGGGTPPVNMFSPTISDPVLVKASLMQVVDTLTKHGAKGAIANVPEIGTIPFFNTIPWNGAVLTQGKADTLNMVYSGLGLTHITWTAGPNGFVILDSASPGNMRHATAADHILLTTPSDSLKCGQWGTNPAKPLKDQYVLDAPETQAVSTAITQYNIGIAEIASTYHLALVDVHRVLSTLPNGLLYNGVTLNTQFVSGGAFSLDGVHLTPRGYAYLANQFIKSINATYGATIPEVDILKYNGIIFP